MNEQEIHWIVENLFVGNKLARHEANLEPGRPIDLKAIRTPIIVFACLGRQHHAAAAGAELDRRHLRRRARNQDPRPAHHLHGAREGRPSRHLRLLLGRQEGARRSHLDDEDDRGAGAGPLRNDRSKIRSARASTRSSRELPRAQALRHPRDRRRTTARTSAISPRSRGSRSSARSSTTSELGRSFSPGHAAGRGDARATHPARVGAPHVRRRQSADEGGRASTRSRSPAERQPRRPAQSLPVRRRIVGGTASSRLRRLARLPRRGLRDGFPHDL